jgi:hypothetical protein
MSLNTLQELAEIILDADQHPQQLRAALDDFARLCTAVSGIVPDPSFDGWDQDIYLDQGLAINPQAAAHCIRDYQRTVVFLRAVAAAINTTLARFPDAPVRILYAGCGPFATLLLPLLPGLKAGAIEIYLLDVHQPSLDSVRQLIQHFNLDRYGINTVCADACTYQHTQSLHLIVAETMQKSLEQEPQVAVTANLAPQLCPGGIFLPEQIEVELCLAQLDEEKQRLQSGREIDRHELQNAGLRYPLSVVLTLRPETAAAQLRAAPCSGGSAQLALDNTTIEIPDLENLQRFDAVLFTRIQVFASFCLRDYESQISLPLRCQELHPLRVGATYQLRYLLGKYPRFDVRSSEQE